MGEAAGPADRQPRSEASPHSAFRVKRRPILGRQTPSCTGVASDSPPTYAESCDSQGGRLGTQPRPFNDRSSRNGTPRNRENWRAVKVQSSRYIMLHLAELVALCVRRARAQLRGSSPSIDKSGLNNRCCSGKHRPSARGWVGHGHSTGTLATTRQSRRSSIQRSERDCSASDASDHSSVEPVYA